MLKYIANLSACCDCWTFAYPNAGLPNAMGGYDQTGPEMAAEIQPFCKQGLVNMIGGCCGSTDKHIAAIREMAMPYKPRTRHDVESRLRLSGLEPLNYEPEEGNYRKTFLKIGERCNVAGSIMYKKAIVEGDYDKAAGIALKQVRWWCTTLFISCMLPLLREGFLEFVACNIAASIMYKKEVFDSDYEKCGWHRAQAGALEMVPFSWLSSQN
jgi:5-methyltetrahydrofolate--homocysteine methyltransferase